LAGSNICSLFLGRQIVVQTIWATTPDIHRGHRPPELVADATARSTVMARFPIGVRTMVICPISLHENATISGLAGGHQGEGADL
jgi:hypothetical protein